MQPFSTVAPISVRAWCDATLYRFARKEVGFLSGLKRKVFDFLGDGQLVASQSRNELPAGGIQHPAILNILLDAVALKGQHARYQDGACRSSHGMWFKEGQKDRIQDCCVASPAKSVSLQSAVYGVFRTMDVSRDFHRELTQKVVTTVGDTLARTLRVNSRWGVHLINVLEDCRPHIKMCVWKTLMGAWTTSWPMHEFHKHGCLFGCRGEVDDIRHYIVCAPLWYLTGEVLGSPPL